MSDKVRVTVVLDKESVEAINNLKPEDISLTAKVRAIIKNWIEERNEKSP